MMCGTDLTEISDIADQEPASDATPAERVRNLKPLHIVILVIVTIAILSGSVVLGMNLASGAVSPELPTFTPTITSSPTVTPSPTTTPTPTATPLPTNTPTPIPPIEYVVQSGDTLLEIALVHDMTVEELQAYNNLGADEFIVEGQTLMIPPPTPTPGPTPTPRPGEPTATQAPFQLHTVKSGETLSEIAEQYRTSVGAILEANDLPADTETIQVNQVLTIPRSTPTPTPEIIVNVTATPTAGLMNYPAPAMLFPPSGSVFTGDDVTIALQWASVGILDDREYYQVELIVPTEDGRETYYDYVKSTTWRVPGELLPPETVEDRDCSWRIFVVRQVTDDATADYKIISQSSARRTFTWRIEPETE
jgi:LysM repeat protein